MGVTWELTYTMVHAMYRHVPELGLLYTGNKYKDKRIYCSNR